MLRKLPKTLSLFLVFTIIMTNLISFGVPSEVEAVQPSPQINNVDPQSGETCELNAELTMQNKE